MRWPLVLFLVCALFAPAASADDPRIPALVVSVVGVPKSKGLVRVAVYRDEKKQWLKEKYVVATASAPAKRGTTVVRVLGLMPGRYGVAVFHDEDGDGELDKNLVGIPSEFYGFSRNPDARLGPPDIKDARFRYGPKGLKLSIRVHNWL